MSDNFRKGNWSERFEWCSLPFYATVWMQNTLLSILVHYYEPYPTVMKEYCSSYHIISLEHKFTNQIKFKTNNKIIWLDSSSCIHLHSCDTLWLNFNCNTFWYYLLIYYIENYLLRLTQLGASQYLFFILHTEKKNIFHSLKTTHFLSNTHVNISRRFFFSFILSVELYELIWLIRYVFKKLSSMNWDYNLL